jgi:hypothetical protein
MLASFPFLALAGHFGLGEVEGRGLFNDFLRRKGMVWPVYFRVENLFLVCLPYMETAATFTAKHKFDLVQHLLANLVAAIWAKIGKLRMLPKLIKGEKWNGGENAMQQKRKGGNQRGNGEN